MSITINLLKIIIIRIFTQDNPSVHCTVINGVLDIELNWESILRREETGVPRGNPRSQAEID